MVWNTILGKFKQLEFRTSVTAMSCHFMINSIIKLKYFFTFPGLIESGGQRTVGSYCKKIRRKRDSKIREIDWSYLCLQRFDKFWTWSAGKQKRKLSEFAETCMEKLVKSLCSVRTKIPKNHEIENNYSFSCHFEYK